MRRTNSLVHNEATGESSEPVAVKPPRSPVRDIWPERTDASDMVTSIMLTAIVLGILVGAVTGQLLAIGISNGALLALASGAVSVLVVSVATNAFAFGHVGFGKNDVSLPPTIVLSALFASAAGSLSGYYIVLMTGQAYSWGIGAAAGLFSSILMTLLVLAYTLDSSKVHARYRSRR